MHRSDSLPPLAAGAAAPQVGGPPAADGFASRSALRSAHLRLLRLAPAPLPLRGVRCRALAPTRGCGPARPSASSCALRAHEGRTLGARRPCAPSSLANSRRRGRPCAGRRDPSRPSLRKASAPPRVPPHFGRCSAVVRCSAVQGERLAADGANQSPKTCALRTAPGRRTIPSVPLDRFLLAARVARRKRERGGGASHPLPRQACPRPPPCVNARKAFAGTLGASARVVCERCVCERAQTGATRPQAHALRA